MDPNTEKEILAQLDQLKSDVRLVLRLIRMMSSLMVGVIVGFSIGKSGQLGIIWTVGVISLCVGPYLVLYLSSTRKRKKEAEFRFRQ